MHIFVFDTIIGLIDAEVATRKSEKFGIRFGTELYGELARIGKIKMATATAWGTGAYPEDIPAYDGIYYAISDWNLEPLAFKVGVPD